MAHASFLSPLGALTVYADDQAVVGVGWHPATCGLLTPLVRTAIEELEAYFDGDLRTFTTPIRLDGTAYQNRAWRAIAAIPYGAAVSYADLARDLDSGPRAIASACARNRIPVFVPCHRVIASGGGLGGYSGGEGRKTKAALLELENTHQHHPERGDIAQAKTDTTEEAL